jgi:hypothetical protein
MKQKIYDFATKKSPSEHETISNEVFEVRDYFQYYTTGLEDVIQSSLLTNTDRFDNERSEVLAYSFFKNEMISDVILALNNDTYLWDAPFDSDMEEVILENKMNIIKHLNKAPLDAANLEGYTEKISKDLIDLRDDMRIIVVPQFPELQLVIRNLKKYLESRVVV